MPPEYRRRIEASRPMFNKRAREQYGLEINSGPFGINSRPALVAEKYAESQGKGETFHKAVMDAYWQQARSIEDTNVLKEITQHVGLNTENFEDVLTNPTYDAEVSADIELAREYRLDGVPALVFEEKYLVVGAQSYDTLKQVIEKIQEEETM
jgi:predicted DsbA family dithiol-disulfide isomerase